MAKQKKTGSGIADWVQPAFERIVSLIEPFCHEHLNEEYAVLCRKLAEKLARKRPSPLLSGSPYTWASGIVRTVGWVNFLHDKNQTPHMCLYDIDTAFGISESTGAAKLAAIRKMLRIHQLDPNWSLPSRLNCGHQGGEMMAIRPQKMSEILKEMSGHLLRDPDGASSEAAHIALMFAHIAWNETVGLGNDRSGFRSAWEAIEADNPEMWSDFKSNDVNAMIDELVQFKQEHYPDDQRRILTCGSTPQGTLRVEWLAPAAPGVDSEREMQLFGLVRTGEREQAIQFLQKTVRMSRKDAAKKVASVVAQLKMF